MQKSLKLIIPACVLSFGLGAFINRQNDLPPLTTTLVQQAATIFGIQFTQAEADSMLTGLEEQRKGFAQIRELHLANAVSPALDFNPVPAGMQFDKTKQPFRMSKVGTVNLPANRDELAFYTVSQLSELVRTRKISSVELTQFFLARLKKHDPTLLCVVSLTEELALEQARKADAEIKAGRYRGPLHGIPYGAKDLLSKKGYKTTWGSVPFKDQVIEEDATVIRKLEEAGAVLVAKLTLGELAWGDVWFGGMTRNPWNTQAGSSGSSAGSASAVSAGLVPFAIGSETLGSIVSPSTACGTTGLRPTFGRVSRHGAMALSWTMDKLGPICRSVEDCAIVFNAILGPDGKDRTVVDLPFNYNPAATGLKGLRIGYLHKDFAKAYGFKAYDEAALVKLRELGANLIPLELPEMPIGAMTSVLSVEAAAAFDELTVSNRDDLLVRQIKNAWPNVFRQARFVPAVEYIQANRARTVLIEKMAEQLKNLDLYISPSFASSNLALTNLSGHPCVVLPNGFTEQGTPTSITFIGQLYGEAKLMAAAKAYQDATDFHKKHPPLFAKTVAE
jgi:Asp-tRNA(Asn)/Glu-tRNA(Gln) amidotransferase A subunit family amidase